MTDLFEVVDKKWKLFRKREVRNVNHVMFDFPTGHPRRDLLEFPAKKEKESNIFS